MPADEQIAHDGIMLVSCAQTPQEGEPHYHLFPDKVTPPTKNPDDCICRGAKPGATSRLLIANCPCCDGLVTFVKKACPRGVDCDNKAFIPMRVTLPPDTKTRLRYIDTMEPIV